LYFQGINDFGGAVSIASDHLEFVAMIRQAGVISTGAAETVINYDWKFLVMSTVQQLET